MGPNLTSVVTAACRLPIDFSRGSVSAIELLVRSGYLTVRRDITLERLSDCLAMHPEWIDAWLQWSEDNRSSPSWYIETLGPDEFEVGHYNGGRSSQMQFDDRVRACAEFVSRELEQLAETAELLSSPAAFIRKRLSRWRAK